jgi:hypothetical protein
LSRHRGNPLFVVMLLFAGIIIGFSSLQVPANATAVITLQPPIGPTGIWINVTGTGFTTADSSCTITGSTSYLIFAYTCTKYIGSGTLGKSSFKVGPVSPGTYTVTVTTYPSTNSSASATFTVTAAGIPSITVSPPDGPYGTRVTVQGTGFSISDSSCQLRSNTTNLLYSQSCSVSSGILSASFTVGNATTKRIRSVINATANTGDSAITYFFIDPQPILKFSINSVPVVAGAPGSTVYVSLKSGNFSSGDTSCSISSIPSGLFQTSACFISSSGHDLTGTFFVVAPAANGSSYQVQVTGNLGDVGTGVFTVIVSPQVTLVPNIGQAGQTVSFYASGLLIVDSSCSLNATAASPSAGHLLASPTCSISGGVATGSFVVASTATADGSPYKVTVIGNPGNDRVSGLFTVIPTITLSPNNGPFGTFVSITGAGFSSTSTSCVGKTGPFPLTTRIACVVTPTGTGQVLGSFIVNGTANIPAGIYVVTIQDNIGYNASAFFTVGAPTAQITIYPNIGLAKPPGPTSAGVTGSGFSVNDNKCGIIAGGTSALIASYTCNIYGGIVGGSFTVFSSAAPGFYLITVNASVGTTPNDFASNYFEIVSTANFTTTTTPTTTTFTTTTGSTTTTSIPVTLTTTTFTSTGISTYVSYTLTTTTWTGQSTYSSESTTTTTTLVTSASTTTTSITISTTYTLVLVVRPPVFSSQGFDGNMFGLISLMSLLGWVLIRRLVF